jgi:16S rRNA processing protein RimM
MLNKPFNSSVDSQSHATPDDLIEVGRVLSAYGLNGSIKVQPFSPTADTLLTAKRWWLVSLVSPNFFFYKVKSAKSHSGSIVVTFDPVLDRNQAEALKGQRIWVSRADFPQTEPDEYYWVDLIGCDVLTDALELSPVGSITTKLGVVDEVLDHAAHAILSVRQQMQDAQGQWVDMLDKKGQVITTLIPFVAAHVTAVDIKSRTIHTNWSLDF